MPGHHLLNLLTHRDQFRYAVKVKGIASANLIAYWPLSEPSGTVVNDVSGNGRNGVYTAVTLGQPGIGDGRTSASFDGTTSLANVFGASLAAAFSATEGSFGMWIKVSAAAVWADGIIRRFGVLQADANNKILEQKVAGANTLQPNHVSATVSKSQAITTTSTDWMHVLMTWSTAADQVCHYYNGVLQGTPGTSIGTWVGALTVATIGAGDVTPANVWSGLIAHAALWSTPLSAAQIAQLASVG